MNNGKSRANQTQNIPPEFDLKNQIIDRLSKEHIMLGKIIGIKLY